MLPAVIQLAFTGGSPRLGCIVPALQQGLHIVSTYATKSAPPYLKEVKGHKQTKKADAKPRRAVSAYAFYVKEQSPLRQGTGTKMTDIMKQLGAEWKTLSDAQRQPYQQLAEASKAAAASAREATKQAKGPPSAYNTWCKEIAQELRAANPAMKATDMMKEAAARWKSLPEGEKERRKAVATTARDIWKKQQSV